MARLDFALWDAVGGYGASATAMADVYDDHIRLAQSLDEAGWHSYFVIEHQNSPIGRITAPTVFLTAVARATQRLRIGAMMWQLPFYHPIRLAQEVAMLDQLSRGRVEFGTGIGVHEQFATSTAEQLDLASLCSGTIVLQSLLEERSQSQCLQAQFHATGLEFGDDEQIFNQKRQALGIALDSPQEFLQQLRIFFGAIEQGFDVTAHQRKRCAKLMAHVGNEILPGVLEPL